MNRSPMLRYSTNIGDQQKQQQQQQRQHPHQHQLLHLEKFNNAMLPAMFGAKHHHASKVTREAKLEEVSGNVSSAAKVGKQRHSRCLSSGSYHNHNHHHSSSRNNNRSQSLSRPSTTLKAASNPLPETEKQITKLTNFSTATTANTTTSTTTSAATITTATNKAALAATAPVVATKRHAPKLMTTSTTKQSDAPVKQNAKLHNPNAATTGTTITTATMTTKAALAATPVHLAAKRRTTKSTSTISKKSHPTFKCSSASDKDVRYGPLCGNILPPNQQNHLSSNDTDYASAVDTANLDPSAQKKKGIFLKYEPCKHHHAPKAAVVDVVAAPAGAEKQPIIIAQQLKEQSTPPSQRHPSLLQQVLSLHSPRQISSALTFHRGKDDNDKDELSAMLQNEQQIRWKNIGGDPSSIFQKCKQQGQHPSFSSCFFLHQQQQQQPSPSKHHRHHHERHTLVAESDDGLMKAVNTSQGGRLFLL